MGGCVSRDGNCWKIGCNTAHAVKEKITPNTRLASWEKRRPRCKIYWIKADASKLVASPAASRCSSAAHASAGGRRASSARSVQTSDRNSAAWKKTPSGVLVRSERVLRREFNARPVDGSEAYGLAGNAARKCNGLKDVTGRVAREAHVLEAPRHGMESDGIGVVGQLVNGQD